ncbi:MAG: hypothetical protein WA418_14275, partial [Bradyrhizobium sp.]
YGCGSRPHARSIRKNTMSEPLPPWLANVDPRFVRHDWKKWVRPDWQRWMPPDPGPSLRERLWRPYREEPPHQRRAAGQLESDILAFRCDLAALRFKLALIKGALRLKVFDPNQPRVPAGNPEGGQWTSGGGAISSEGGAHLPSTPVSSRRTRIAQLAPSGDTATDAGPQFRVDRPGWHDYTAGPNLVCGAELQCSREEMADQLARYSVPGQDPATPALEGDRSLVYDPRSGVPGGFVETTIADGGLTITNRTSPLHAFYDGVVVRSAKQADDGSWYVTTRGFGNNVIPGMSLFNQEEGPPIFDTLDRRMRANIERHHGKGVPALAMRRVDGRGHPRRHPLLAGSHDVR